jgi:hypothetical protein
MAGVLSLLKSLNLALHSEVRVFFNLDSSGIQSSPNFDSTGGSSRFSSAAVFARTMLFCFRFCTVVM